MGISLPAFYHLQLVIRIPSLAIQSSFYRRLGWVTVRVGGIIPQTNLDTKG